MDSKQHFAFFCVLKLCYSNIVYLELTMMENFAKIIVLTSFVFTTKIYVKNATSIDDNKKEVKAKRIFHNHEFTEHLYLLQSMPIFHNLILISLLRSYSLISLTKVEMRCMFDTFEEYEIIRNC